MDKKNTTRAKVVSNRSRIALFGGSFDPVHCGHLEVARCALEQAGLERVIFLPAAQAPLKQEPFFDDTARLEMLRLALQSDSRFELDTYEIKEDGINYTVDTVDYFKKLYRRAKLFLIIGEDQFVQLDKWNRIDELVKTISFLVYPRESKVKAGEKCIPDVRYEMLKAEKISISSTEVRNCFKNGLSISGLVPDEVEAFIYEKGLYDRNSKNL